MSKFEKHVHGPLALTLSELDELLAVPGALDDNALETVRRSGRVPIVDDPPDDLPVDPGSAGRRFLSAKEEAIYARRIEFSRRRMIWTAHVSTCPSETRDRYLDAVDGAEEFADEKAPRGESYDEDDIHARWNEYLRHRNRLIEANLALVERIAMRYRTYGIPSADLVQHGNLGLIRAADKFDWRKNVRFRTYAEWWIRQAVERATDTDRDVIHVPRPMRQKISKANHINRAEGHNKPLDASRFAELMGVERGAAARVFSIKSGIASLERSGPEEGQPIKNDLVGPDLSGRAETEETEHLRTRLDDMMSELPERERRVINLRYGLEGDAPRTLEEVGSMLKISRERVRQLQNRAIGHLRVVAPDPRVGVGS